MAKRRVDYADLPFQYRSEHHTPGRVWRIECGTCDRFEELGRHHMSPALAAERLPAIASTRGWLVGRKPKDHRCPACWGSKEFKPPNTVAAMPAPKEPPMDNRPTLVSVPAASAPRTMTREDRRVVFAKLDEVYVDEKTGYSPGWSDERVATDLGVPRAWVEAIREENFGPNTGASKAELAEAKAALEILWKNLEELGKVHKDNGAAIATLRGRVDDLRAIIVKLERQLR